MDIRQKYSNTADNIPMVASILRLRMPTVKRDALSSFDCLIVVIRWIYSYFMLGGGGPCDWMAAAEKKNPLLRHAWSLFGNDTMEIKEAAKNRRRVLESLTGLCSSFEDLCNSPLMNETFWSHHEFALFDDLLCLDTGEHVQGSLDEFGNASLVELNLLMDPSLTLEDVIQKSFGIVPFNDQYVVSRPNRPFIVRVVYTPNLNASERLGINDLRTLHLPIWEQREDEEQACYDVVGKNKYILLAVVRLRDDRHPQDYVRTYNSYGANVAAENPCDVFVNSSWSVKDNGGKYMLFYALDLWESLDDPTRFPEVARPQLTEDDIEVFSMSDRLMAGPTEPPKKSQPPQTRAAVETGTDGRGTHVSAQPTEPASQPSNKGLSKSAKKRKRQEPKRTEAAGSNDQASGSYEPDASKRSRDSRRSPI